MRSLILVGGPPGSGKTTLGDLLVDRLSDVGVCHHVSIGDVLREIASGERQSNYTELVAGADSPLTRAEPMPLELVHSVVIEALDTGAAAHDVAIVSGYPRYRSQKHLGIELVGRFETSCIVRIDCDYTAAATRLFGRPDRRGEVAADQHRFDIRWQEYVAETQPVLEALIPAVTGWCQLDGGQPADVVATDADAFLRSTLPSATSR